METKKIPVGSGKFALVDDADYDWLNQYMWYTDHYGYVMICFSRSILAHAPIPDVASTGISMSRLILELEPGDKREADHINHNILDNRRNNLRIATRAQNQYNQSIRDEGTSKFKGVYWDKQNKKWHAHISINNKTKSLGRFDSERTAALAYNLAAKRHFKEFAFLNKI